MFQLDGDDGFYGFFHPKNDQTDQQQDCAVDMGRQRPPSESDLGAVGGQPRSRGTSSSISSDNEDIYVEPVKNFDPLGVQNMGFEGENIPMKTRPLPKVPYTVENTSV